MERHNTNTRKIELRTKGEGTIEVIVREGEMAGERRGSDPWDGDEPGEEEQHEARDAEGDRR